MRALLRYLFARCWEPSTHEAIGWLLAMISWSQFACHFVNGFLMIAGGGFMLLGALLPEGHSVGPSGSVSTGSTATPPSISG
jgi:hypothetical protein